MKYTLTKHVDKKALVELFLMLSDSFDEGIPDIIWEGSEFEVDINQPEIKTDIEYLSSKKGGEFSIKLTWITPAAKKQLAEDAEKKTKEKIAKGEAASKTPGSKIKPSTPRKTKKSDSDEDLWSEDDDDFDISADDADWETEDFDDEW